MVTYRSQRNSVYDVPDVYTLFNCQHLSLISDLRSNSVACNLVKATSVEYRVRQETLLQCYQYIVQCKQLLKLCPFHTWCKLFLRKDCSFWQSSYRASVSDIVGLCTFVMGQQFICWDISLFNTIYSQPMKASLKRNTLMWSPLAVTVWPQVLFLTSDPTV